LKVSYESKTADVALEQILLLVFKIELKRRNRHRTVLVVTSLIDRGLRTYQS